MKNVTDRISNPFGMNPPVSTNGAGTPRAVYGYGDANADFHLIGKHCGDHGGRKTGIPFTGTDPSRRLQSVFRSAGFLRGPSTMPNLRNLFMNYLYMPTDAADREPNPVEYAEFERFFDAELRAINPHILLPVGEASTDHVLEEYSTQRHRFSLEMDRLHGREIRGRGFLIVPIRDPSEWSDRDGPRIRQTLRRILESDYRQTKGVATVVG